MLGPALAIDKRPGVCIKDRIDVSVTESYSQCGLDTHGVGQLEVLVGKLVSVDGLSTSSVVVGEITSLEHELGCRVGTHRCQLPNSASERLTTMKLTHG